MSDMDDLQGPLPEAVGTAGYTLAVGLFDIMVRKGLMSVEEARQAMQDWAQRSRAMEGTSNHDAAAVIDCLARNFNVQTG
jgi:polyhydroxyalkanoate synthesis regulator phasin